ncbi:MAG TPA: fumarylacetoacetate hydrolase family protein [Blastococcus sp.]|jgi:2-keto-4-pentenoate hydratase
MTTDQVVAEAAARLTEASESGTPCPPVRDLLGTHDVELAYRVQDRLVRARVAAGDLPIGRKIGLTSVAVQKQLGVEQPDFGTLLTSMQVEQDVPVASGRLLQPRIEAEVAFVLGADLTSLEPTVEEVAAAVSGVRAALEIVDSRIAGWDIGITDTVADNASSGMFVLGDVELTLEQIRPVDVTMELERDGEVVSTGTGAACLGDPLVAVQWLARTAAALGQPLRAGEVVLSGALGPMVPVTPGERYVARISGLGEVRATFAADVQGDSR